MWVTGDIEHTPESWSHSLNVLVMAYFRTDKLSASNDTIFGRFRMWGCSTCDIWHVKMGEGGMEARREDEIASGDFWQIFIVRLTLSGARRNLMPLNEVPSPPISPLIRHRCCHFGGWNVLYVYAGMIGRVWCSKNYVLNIERIFKKFLKLKIKILFKNFVLKFLSSF